MSQAPVPEDFYQTQLNAYQTNTFQSIRQQALRTGQLYSDPNFLASDISIFGRGGKHGPHRIRYNGGNIYWKRPGEISRTPAFISNGVSRFDVIQGELGNCWLVAAIANLTMYPGLFGQVVPGDNGGFRPGEYTGAFHFRFWIYGHWTDVIIDDRLPCTSRGELLFLHSEDTTEFWSALLEKAYAKLHGSYESLAGGTASEALQDFSGGIVEGIDIEVDERKQDLFRTLKKAYDRASLLSCCVFKSGTSGYEERIRNELVRGHAYSITSIQVIQLRGGGVEQLIRIRNPWGDKYEWNGAWSDGSREWNLVDPSIRQRLGVTNRSDGEFWMCMRDFQREFSRVEICHLSPDPVDTHIKISGTPWKKEIHHGSWLRSKGTAGGCLNFSTFASNPQFFFHFEASDHDGDSNKCTIIVSLLQKRVQRSALKDRDYLCIGFRIFKLSDGVSYTNDGRTKLDLSTLKSKSKYFEPLSSGAYADSREVSARFEVPTGNYCIVPSTFEPNQEGDFLLRVFSEPSGFNAVESNFQNLHIGGHGPNPVPPQVTYPYHQPRPFAPAQSVPGGNYPNQQPPVLAQPSPVPLPMSACPYPSGGSGLIPSLPGSGGNNPYQPQNQSNYPNQGYAPPSPHPQPLFPNPYAPASMNRQNPDFYSYNAPPPASAPPMAGPYPVNPSLPYPNPNPPPRGPSTGIGFDNLFRT